MPELNLDYDASEARQDKLDAARYRWIRNRDENTIENGGIFAGQTPQNLILTKQDLDKAIDAEMSADKPIKERHVTCDFLKCDYACVRMGKCVHDEERNYKAK